MNKSVAYGTFFATGLALGGGGGYLLAKKKFRLLAEEEVESVRKAFHELNRISREAADSKNPESSDPEGATSKQPAMGLSQQPRTQAANREFVDYNKIVANEQYVGPKGSPGPSDSEVDPRIVEDVPVKAVEVEVNEQNNVDVRVTYEQAASALRGAIHESTEPHLIDVGEFMTNESEYDQFTMTWYAGDQTLVFDDQPDEMVDDLSIVGGLTALGSFGLDSMNEHTIYVRDDDSQKMYEIVRDTRRFSAGIDK